VKFSAWFDCWLRQELCSKLATGSDRCIEADCQLESFWLVIAEVQIQRDDLVPKIQRGQVVS
jgi:hypothetical protein